MKNQEYDLNQDGFTFLRGFIDKKESVTQMKISEADLNEFEKIDCNLSLGDLVVFSSKAVHRSGINKIEEPRVAMVIRLSSLTGKLDSGWQAEV